jgi:hypothetical protein
LSQTQVGNEDYSCSILSTVEEIRSLKAPVGAAAQNDVFLDPEFFLSSVGSGWRPRVAAIESSKELAGVVYAKERVVLGCALGVAYADLSWGNLQLGSRFGQERAFRLGIEGLLDAPGIRGIRLRILRGSPEAAAIRKIIATRDLDVYFSRVRDHSVLPLPDTYEKLLKSFGSTTRHNFRYYRRRFEAAGHTYVDSMTLGELRAAAGYLQSRCRIGSQGAAVERILNMVGAAEQIMAVGLKHKNGEWLSAIAGVYRPGAGVLLLQLSDDKGYPRDSLAVVLRGYLIESLIQRGFDSLAIWGGTAPPLSRYVKYIPTVGVHLDMPSGAWRLARRLVAKLGPWMPRRLSRDARWIAPFRLRAATEEGSDLWQRLRQRLVHP